MGIIRKLRGRVGDAIPYGRLNAIETVHGGRGVINTAAAANQLLTGPQGPTGAKGDTGVAGPQARRGQQGPRRFRRPTFVTPQGFSAQMPCPSRAMWRTSFSARSSSSSTPRPRTTTRLQRVGGGAAPRWNRPDAERVLGRHTHHLHCDAPRIPCPGEHAVSALAARERDHQRREGRRAASGLMQGRRRPDGASPFDLEPGEFTKHRVTNVEETERWDQWYVRAPDGSQPFYLANEHNPDRNGRFHEVEEHEDGMISVMPRPENSNSIMAPHESWHGWIRHGEWVTQV